MEQPALPLGKRIQDTSLQAYRELAPTLQPREQQVIEALQSFSEPPTAYEIAERMIARRQIRDVNMARPRLCALQERGRVEKGDKRKCSVTGKAAYTWRLVQE